MYAREIDGETYTFGVSGKLLRNVLVMYDRESNSEWSQILGEALTGPLTGTKLELVPSSRMSWKEWRKRYSNTLALRKPRYTGFDSYDSYYRSDAAGLVGETIRDDRLEIKQLVVGIKVADTVIAYPYFELETSPVLNDAVAERELLITFDAKTESIGVFDRELEGQALTFSEVEGDNENMRDHETGSTWNRLTGRGVAGPFKDKALAKMPYTSSFWFGWKDNYPETLVYGE